MDIKHITICFIIHNCLLYFSNTFFLKYNVGEEIYSWTTTTTTQNSISDEHYDFLPRMMIFEPDKVLWPFNAGADVVKPFLIKEYQPSTHPSKNKRRVWNEELYIECRELIDHNGTVMAMHKDSAKVIVHLIKKGIKVAVAETSGEIIIIRHLLHLFDIDHLFDFMEIDLESPVDHVKIIKEESGIDYQDIIYFGGNRSVLDEIRKAVNIITIYVNPESGINIKHVYQAIYIYNIKPHINIVDGEPQYLGHVMSGEEVLKETKIMKKPKWTTSQQGNLPLFPTTIYTTIRMHIESSKEQQINKQTKIQRKRTKTIKQRTTFNATFRNIRTTVSVRSGNKFKFLNTGNSKTENRMNRTITKGEKSTVRTIFERFRTTVTIKPGRKPKRLCSARFKIENKTPVKIKQKIKHKNKHKDKKRKET